MHADAPGAGSPEPRREGDPTVVPAKAPTPATMSSEAGITNCHPTAVALDPTIEIVRFDVPGAGGNQVGERRGYALQRGAGLGWTSLPPLPLIRQRAPLLAGTDGPLIPMANAHMMCRLLPNAALNAYDDGHVGLITHAADLGPVVARSPHA